MKTSRSYVLISPCRNEAAYMRQTPVSVISQSIRPAKWVIVDDGSTDETPRIPAEYRANHDCIEGVPRSDRGRRAVGPGVSKAYLEEDGHLVAERHGDETSLGMTKFHRVSCFMAIGGFVRDVISDGIDCHHSRMKGWIA